MTGIKIVALIIIIAGLIAATVGNRVNMPSRDFCNKPKSVLEICYETEGCSLSANELYRLTNYRETMAEICPRED